MDKILQQYKMLIQLMRLPVAHLQFHEHIDPGQIRATYHHFTRPHPRYKIIRHKTIGAALIDLESLSSPQQYLDQIKGKNGGAWHAKRARSRGYRVMEIDRNRYVDDIHAINTALEQRQGRPMDRAYRDKQSSFETLAHFRYFGMFNADGKLVGYANLGRFGNFGGFAQLIGLRNNDGFMHLLVVDIVSQLIEQREVRYLMYDTFFGAHPGMQTFKKILGFRPYRAKYSLQ
ncbi:hypothetical protein GCM10027321_30970 [Massilia terrae]|uniref:N-acetyltransferase domain-containing protein n=1 Tax=Massilia terrae TaxID=1811224 RepID=A0ABT2D1B1_9BURK|nr:hypothetical protein [Massilia terrae]MCS0660024.1 hypothetical protein [Massilia terrae]